MSLIFQRRRRRTAPPSMSLIFQRRRRRTAPPSLPPISLPPSINPIISTKSPPPKINKDLNQYASSQIVNKLLKLFNNTRHTHYKIHCPQLLLHLTLTQEQILIKPMVPHRTPKRSPPLATTTYTSHHQDQ